MRRLFSMMLVAMLALTGCGTSDDTLDGTISVGISGTPTELETYKTLGEKFTEETGVEIEFRQYTDFNTEIQAELIGGTAPDVFPVDAYFFPFLVEQGVISPVDTETMDLSTYNQNLLESFQYDGTQYAVPKDYSTLAIYYNKDYVNPEELPTSYEELGDYLRELDETLPDDVAPMTVNIDLARQMYLAQAAGDEIVNAETGMAQLDSEEVAKNLNYEMELAQEGLMVTPADLGVGWNGEAFGTGKTAIMLEGNWVAGELNTNYSDIDYGVTENFTIGGNKGSMLFTVGWVENAATKQSAEAQAFIDFMTNAENIQYATEQNGTLPAREDVAETLGLTEDEVFGPHVAASEYATTWQAGTTLATINTEYMNYMPSVISGDRTIEEALAETETQANKIIEESMA